MTVGREQGPMQEMGLVGPPPGRLGGRILQLCTDRCTVNSQWTEYRDGNIELCTHAPSKQYLLQYVIMTARYKQLQSASYCHVRSRSQARAVTFLRVTEKSRAWERSYAVQY